MASRNAAKELDDPDRAALIHEISDVSGVTDINLATWACVWFADISKLRGMPDDLKDNPAKSSTEAWLCSTDAEMDLNAHAGLAKRNNQDAKGEPEKGSSVVYSEGPATVEEPYLGREKCRKGAEVCAITRSPRNHRMVTLYVDALSPWQTGPGLNNQAKIWELAKLLWNTETVARWKSIISSTDNTHTCATVIMLCPNVENLWKGARFGLQPIYLSPDRRRLAHEFYWLHSHVPKGSVTLKDEPVVDGQIRVGPNGLRLLDSGLYNFQIPHGPIILETNDPDNHPLPSMELLEMQWTFNRIIALSGVVK